MPVVLRIDGARVVIFANDHAPAHVHVRAAEREAIVLLNCPDGPVSLRENDGFTTRELGRIYSALQAALNRLCAAWEAIDVQR
jgi:hypothetical protein